MLQGQQGKTEKQSRKNLDKELNEATTRFNQEADQIKREIQSDKRSLVRDLTTLTH
jgi:hypothetical protein